MKNFLRLMVLIITVQTAVFADAENPVRPVEVNGLSGVQEANDRDYFLMVRHLIASARKSIDVSMDAVAYAGEPSDPVKKILDDLMDKSRKQIKVRLFLNTQPGSREALPFFLREDVLSALRKESVEVHYVNPGYVLHDRLMLVDGEWVLEGGLRWTREDLEKGLGSATLSRSSELAEKKRLRLELLPLWDIESRKAEIKEGTVPVPVYLMRDIKYFPGMLRSEDSDALRIYLALLRAFFMRNQVQLSFSLEELAAEIPADAHFARTEASFQVLKSLERLETVYSLIKLTQKGPERAELTLILPQDFRPAVRLPLPFFTEGYAKQISANGIMAYLIILLKSQASGDSPVWLGSERDVEQDFPMTREKFRMGVSELKRKNLVEVFPFRLQGKYSRLENLEYRYVINLVTTMSEKLQIWDRLREQYDEEKFSRAREMAEALEEDEDPKVISAYLDFIKEFPEHNLLSLTQHIASLPASSTPEKLAYLKELLEHEIPDSALATS